MMHQCQALVINCVDFRLVKKTQEYLDNSGLANDYDLINLAGSTKELAAEPGDEKIKEYILNNINVAYDLHNVRQLIIIHHSDCGAYGGSKAFAGPEKEREFQIVEMQKSSEIIKNSFLEFKIANIYAKINGEEIEFEKIV